MQEYKINAYTKIYLVSWTQTATGQRLAHDKDCNGNLLMKLMDLQNTRENEPESGWRQQWTKEYTRFFLNSLTELSLAVNELN